jgi:hypothetical protein
VRDERTGLTGRLARLLFLRGLRCKPNCGWRGFRFSRTQFRRRKRHLKVTVVVVLFVAIAVITIRYLVLRGGMGGGAHDDGIQEVE